MNANDELLKRIDELFAARLEPVNQRLEIIDKRQNSFEKELKKQGKKLDHVKETLDVAIKVFDRGDGELRKRVKRLEKHVGLSPFE